MRYKLTKKQEEKFKRRALRVINERVGELLDEIKREFQLNLEDSGIFNFKEQFEIIKELEIIKTRIWRYK